MSPNPLRLTDADRAAWAQYEAASKRAAELYKALPIAIQRAAIASNCACGKKIPNPGGKCRACRAGRTS